jgi:quercetin 2,3-dioxygenase
VSTQTSVHRRIVRTVTTPPPAPGFAGPGHTASLVVDPAEFAVNDPFIVLADDRLELARGAHVGGEHPHAGFEIATFVVEGALIDRDEGVLRAGDLLWTRAGRGIIHNEEVTTEGRTRILQLWRALPEHERWSEPWFETTTRDEAPVRREPAVIPSGAVIPSVVEGSAPVIPSPSTSLRAGSV